LSAYREHEQIRDDRVKKFHAPNAILTSITLLPTIRLKLTTVLLFYRKTIIDWVQKNGRRASVKCKSLKRKGSFPQNDTRKLHCSESVFTNLGEVLGDKGERKLESLLPQTIVLCSFSRK